MAADSIQQFHDLTASLQRRYARDLEEMCERSLVDLQERGVLVLTGPEPGQWEMRLDSSVPWGMIHERPA